MLLLFTGGSGSGIDPHPLAYLFDAADGFIYDGAYASGGVDFGVDGTTECAASGDPCGFVRDVSGNDWNLEQAVSANRLTFRTTVGGIKSFITGPTTNGGSAKWAEVTGSTDLTAEYTDIAVFKFMKLNDPDGDIMWDITNFTGTGASMDANYRVGYASAAPNTSSNATYTLLRNAGSGTWSGSSCQLPVIDGAGFMLMEVSPSSNVGIRIARRAPVTASSDGPRRSTPAAAA